CPFTGAHHFAAVLYYFRVLAPFALHLGTRPLVLLLWPLRPVCFDVLNGRGRPGWRRIATSGNHQHGADQQHNTAQNQAGRCLDHAPSLSHVHRRLMATHGAAIRAHSRRRSAYLISVSASPSTLPSSTRSPLSSTGLYSASNLMPVPFLYMKFAPNEEVSSVSSV